MDVAPNGARLRLCLLAQELQAERRKHQDHPYTRELAFPEQIPEKHKVQPYDDDHHKQDVQHSRHVLAHSFSKLVSERSAWSRYLRSQFPPGGEVPLCRGTTTPHHVCAVLSERIARFHTQVQQELELIRARHRALTEELDSRSRCCAMCCASRQSGWAGRAVNAAGPCPKYTDVADTPVAHSYTYLSCTRSRPSSGAGGAVDGTPVSANSWLARRSRQLATASSVTTGICSSWRSSPSSRRRA